jgi:ribonucleoside-diphosphate reductase alpha chain
VDYVFRWMGARFLSKDERDALGIISRDDSVVPALGSTPAALIEPRHDDASASSLASPSEGAIPTSEVTSSSTTISSIGGVGGPKASTDKAEPPPVPAGGTDLPVHSNGHSNGHAEAKLPIKPLDLGGGTKVAFSVSADSPSCADCGSIMVRNGSCYKCLNCGSTSGCS